MDNQIHKHRVENPTEEVIVLGASGFVGQNLMNELSGMDGKLIGLRSKDVDLTQSDSVPSLERLISPKSTIIFVSALCPSRGRDVATLLSNLKMMENFASVLEKKNVKYVVYVSSDAVYLEKAALIREDTPTAPSSFHGIMHFAREGILREVTARKGIPVFFLRPCALYGVGDPHNSYGPNRFLRMALEGKELTLSGHGEEKRDHLLISDLARLLLMCIEEGATGVLNAAIGRAASFYDVARIVQSYCPRKVEIKFTERASPITHKHFDITQLATHFPSFAPTSLEEGIRRVFDQNAPKK